MQQHFRELKQAAKATDKVRLKGTTKYMPAMRILYPKYCDACDKIERHFAELKDLVRQLQKDWIHMGYIDDELFDAIIEKQSEITRCKYCDNNYYSRFLYYDQRVCEALMNIPREEDSNVHCTILLPNLPKD